MPRSSSTDGALGALTREIVACRRCPRLVAWREDVAREKRAAFRDEEYWGRPVPGFGDPDARVLVVGLAPAAHGGNRTGRVFTGDRSGDWLFAALFRAGFASSPVSQHAGDGLKLHDAYVAAAVRCAPPANKPTRDERDRCLPYLGRELDLLALVSVAVVLGAFAYEAFWKLLADRAEVTARPRPRFTHGLEVAAGRVTILGCYHPSQQNTFTGKLTPAMIDDVLAQAKRVAAAG